jgi:hypothetical protein
MCRPRFVPQTLLFSLLIAGALLQQRPPAVLSSQAKSALPTGGVPVATSSVLWQAETVIADAGIGDIALAFDRLAQPQLAFVNQSAYQIQYAERMTNAWNVVPVGEAGGAEAIARDVAIAVDPSNTPHMSYSFWYKPIHSLFPRFYLFHATYTSKSWQMELLNSDGRDSSLVLDTTGRGHVSYTIQYIGGLYGPYGGLGYAQQIGTEWHMQTIETIGDSISTLALDSNDRPHIGYYNREQGALKYAHWDGQRWQIEIIDQLNYSPQAIAFVVDATNHIHVSYYRPDGNLIYAYRTNCGWQRQVVSDVATTDRFVALQVTSTGWPVLVYSDTTTSTLRLAWLDQTQWHHEVIDQGVFTAPALALNAASFPALAYFDSTAYKLVYTQRQSPIEHTVSQQFADPCTYTYLPLIGSTSNGRVQESIGH